MTTTRPNERSVPMSARQAPAAGPERDLWRWVLLIAAVGNLANGAWMLADPAGWFAGIPAAVPDSGPLNEHFVRDLGATFTMCAVGMAWAAFVPALRFPLLALVSLFYVLHALVHVWDTVRGLLPPSHWVIDAPAVYVPAVLLVVLTAMLARKPAGR